MLGLFHRQWHNGGGGDRIGQAISGLETTRKMRQISTKQGCTGIQAASWSSCGLGERVTFAVLRENTNKNLKSIRVSPLGV
jgi:hypothetical protein